jgi:hypothetical protein
MNEIERAKQLALREGYIIAARYYCAPDDRRLIESRLIEEARSRFPITTEIPNTVRREDGRPCRLYEGTLEVWRDEGWTPCVGKPNVDVLRILLANPTRTITE